MLRNAVPASVLHKGTSVNKLFWGKIVLIRDCFELCGISHILDGQMGEKILQIKRPNNTMQFGHICLV